MNRLFCIFDVVVFPLYFTSSVVIVHILFSIIFIYITPFVLVAFRVFKTLQHIVL